MGDRADHGLKASPNKPMVLFRLDYPSGNLIMGPAHGTAGLPHII